MEHLTVTLPNPAQKHKTRLKTLVSDKHNSLHCQSASNNGKSFTILTSELSLGILEVLRTIKDLFAIKLIVFNLKILIILSDNNLFLFQFTLSQAAPGFEP